MGSRLLLCFLALSAFTACSSARKMRLAEREKLSASTGMYCDFVNGDEYQDVEVELNLQMARRCDSNKSFTVSGYKNASEVHGMVYCCSMPRKEEKISEARVHTPKKTEKAEKIGEKVAAKAELKEEAPALPEAPKAEAPLPPAQIQAPSAPTQQMNFEQPAQNGARRVKAQPRKRMPASQKLDSSDLDAILEN